MTKVSRIILNDNCRWGWKFPPHWLAFFCLGRQWVCALVVIPWSSCNGDCGCRAQSASGRSSCRTGTQRLCRPRYGCCPHSSALSLHLALLLQFLLSISLVFAKNEQQQIKAFESTTNNNIAELLIVSDVLDRINEIYRISFLH